MSEAIVATQQAESYWKSLFYVNNFTLVWMQKFVRCETFVSTREKWPAEGFRPPPHSRSGPGYGRDPVGNGHAAAGFSAVLAPPVTAADGRPDAVIAVRARGLAGLAFFFAAFFFLPATLLDAFFLDDFFLPDAFFFFFFLPPFFAFFFFAITISLEVVAKESPAVPARTIQTPGEERRAH